MLKKKEAAFLEVRELKVWSPVTLRNVVSLFFNVLLSDSVCVCFYTFV